MCSNYAKTWDLKFNENKYVIMNAGRKIYNNDEIILHMNHVKMKIVTEFKYLGLVFHEIKKRIKRIKSKTTNTSIGNC